ncbi:hypothetical protein J4E93_006833 [Alternaria ventricosa]|uniref:uncharacterized protein n=1 Tax=Alternaria ventricosa TaxID=1187951 RepID=UPI0020C3BA58|nr:uncharacterized protein J4E93_006833 [Alternaria ventricosa]KAI4643820.1 hypothetical protein J4E93_006833 [Alternaria ventricosa]
MRTPTPTTLRKSVIGFALTRAVVVLGSGAILRGGLVRDPQVPSASRFIPGGVLQRGAVGKRRNAREISVEIRELRLIDRSAVVVWIWLLVEFFVERHVVISKVTL